MVDPIPQPLPRSDREGEKKYTRLELSAEGWEVRHSGRARGRVWDVLKYNREQARYNAVACCLTEAAAWEFAAKHQAAHDRLVRDFLDRRGY